MYRITLFARRTLQQLLSSNATVLNRTQLQRHVDALNDVSRISLPTEWEVAIIHALSQIATVKYEPNLGGSSRVDVYCETFRESLTFAAEITTVSDQGYEQENPLRKFGDLLIEIARSYDIDPGMLSYEVGGEMVGKRTSQKMKLKLPKKGDLSVFLRRDARAFFHAIKDDPVKHHRWEIRNDAVEITLSYDPSQHYLSGTYPGYKTAYSNTHNSIAEALRSKAGQLKKSGFTGLKGIFLCDGASDLIRSTSRLETVIAEVLRRRTTVNFVIVATVDDRGPRDSRHSVKLDIYFNPRVSDNDRQQLRKLLANLSDAFPKPVERPQTVAANFGRKFIACTPLYASWKLSGLRYSFPSRVLLELLAGNISVDELHKYHWFRDPPGQETPHFFKVMREHGHTIRSITVERIENFDDDWVTFEFGDPDPALVPFRID
jgi:hypothetical protein